VARSLKQDQELCDSILRYGHQRFDSSDPLGWLSGSCPSSRVIPSSSHYLGINVVPNHQPTSQSYVFGFR
jgi:hypothetical protein